MRLFEVDASAVIPILKVLRGLAANNDTSGIIPFATVMNYLKKFDLPLGGVDSDRQQIMTALKNALGPSGEIIKSINPDGSLVLDKPDDPAQAGAKASTGPAVDAMAKSNAKNLQPNL
ncbi:MAG: hypothetical protein EBU90_07925 [Proteobacteria bacterium]|nr:hypothetical protein [Pseudomonadota bacterium]NBP14128.1 hypothetical protein [bacterium]